MALDPSFQLRKYALPLVIGVCIAMVWMNIDEKSYHSVRDLVHYDALCL